MPALAPLAPPSPIGVNALRPPTSLIPGRPYQLPGTSTIVPFRLPPEIPSPVNPPGLPPIPGRPSIPDPGLSRFDPNRPAPNPFYPLFGPPVFGPGESLFSPPQDNPAFYNPPPAPAGAGNPANFSVELGLFRVLYEQFSGPLYQMPFVYPPPEYFLFSGFPVRYTAGDELGRVTGGGYNYGYTQFRDAEGRTTEGKLIRANGTQEGYVPGVVIRQPSDPGTPNPLFTPTASPTIAPPQPQTPDTAPPPLPNPIPDGTPKITPFRQPSQPNTPPEPNKAPPIEPEPEPSPPPQPEPEPPAPQLPPSDPEPPAEPQTPPETPEPPLKPTPAPNPTPTPPPAPVPPVEPQPRVPTPATPAPITVPGAVPIPAPITVPDTVPTPAPIPTPPPTTIPATQPATPPNPAPAPTPTPANPQPAPTPADPQPNPQPAPTPTPVNPQTVPNPEWTPSTDPAVVPGSIPLPTPVNPQTVPNPAPVQPLPIPNAPGFIPAPASPLPISPGAPSPGAPITATNPPVAGIPTTPSSPPITGVPPIPAPTTPIINPPNVVSPPLPTPPPIDPCNADPCGAKISQSVSPTTAQVKTFVRCEDSNPIFGFESIAIPANAVSYVSKIFERLATIEAQQCTEKCPECEPIVTVPEWWEYRPESHRRQGVLVFKELRQDNTLGNDAYSITIPHCILTTAPRFSPLDQYDKGNWQGILTLKDNSKLTVNCIDVEEANRVISAISQVIDPAYLIGSYLKIGQHRGLAYKELRVKAVKLDYYPTGARNLRPAYLKRFV